MKTCKLCVHTEKTYKNQDILLCAKDFPDVKAGDVVELYHPEDEWSRLLLQVKCLPEDYQQRDAVSIEQGISTAFSLRPYSKIVVNKVEPKNVCLDLVELLFKDQYFGRSDMWRMNKMLLNTCVYLKKAIEFAGMRASVHELWSKGDNVTSGLITEDTRVVFRSPTAVVQIFIQMSTEMWDFDLHGDLYFEKAVNGFLTDLFARWKDQKCLHDVTIVMFSRTYYEAKSFEEFPPAVREGLQIDCRGCIYEDFYRVIIQNERYEEWGGVLREMRTIFNTYEDILNFHQHHNSEGWKMPKGHISMAAQGNFLETLNMSLNLFEKYYMDRNFDRTGKVSVVITPGPGVFEVDRQLANITKQRTIDCGVGSDLVCMGEQPLHAAPLFKFHSKSSDHSIEVGDDYNIPHWMNHSFYMSKIQIENHMNSPFVPRIKPPPALLKELEEGPKDEEKSLLRRNDDGHDTNIPFVDYDEYDAQVFKLPSGTMPRTFTTRGRNVHANTVGLRGSALPTTFAEAKRRLVPRTRHISDEVCAYGNDRRDSGKDRSAAITIPSRGKSHDDMSVSFGCYPIQEKALSRDSFESSESDELIHQRCVVGSAGSPVSHSRSLHNYRPRRALINPFAPSRLQFKMTSNRRRWVHAFPVDKSGKAMQARHVHSVQHSGHENDFPWSVKESVKSPLITIVTGSTKKNKNYFDHHDPDNDLASQGSESIAGSPVSKADHSTSSLKRHVFDGQNRQRSGKRQTRSISLNFGGNKTHKIFGSAKTGSEQDWSPDMNTGYDWRPVAFDLRHGLKGSRLTKSFFDGDIQSNTFSAGIAVDWKSLTIPASLPLTTDFFPDRHSLQYDYYVASYQFDVAEEGWGFLARPSTVDEKSWLVYYRPPLTTQQVFLELISQRLGQGFQLITKSSSKQTEPKPEPPQNSTGLFGRVSQINEPDNECYMNIGRIYHKLTSTGSSIKVTWWRPSHPTPQLQYEYRYRFQDPDSNMYDVSWTNFSNERLENYNWNHLDKYICTQGDYWECGLIDSLKYWRSRFFLLPLNNPATKKIIDKETTRCDIYEERSLADCRQLVDGFIKFLETLNKIRRSKPKTDIASGAGGTSSGESSPRKPDTDEFKEKEDGLSVKSPSIKIVEAMMDPSMGLSLIQNQAGLPSNSFISKEAVTWCRKHVAGAENITGAVALLQ
ncbi:dep domain-containing protein 5, partial [Plakobranchus ocellatus]